MFQAIYCDLLVLGDKDFDMFLGKGKKGLILCLFILLTSSIHSKTLFKVHYSIEDGLPSSEVYCTLQDKRGFIWFGTDRGVARFDGKNFKEFTSADGLTGNVVFKMYLDYKGRIWFWTYSSGLCYYEAGKIKPYAYNDHFINIRSNHFLTSLYCDSTDNMTFMFAGVDSVLMIDANGRRHSDVKGRDADLFLKLIDNELFYRYCDVSGYRKISYDVTQKSNNVLKTFYSDVLVPGSRKKMTAEYDVFSKQVFIGVNNRLVCLSDSEVKVITTFKTRILNICPTKKGIIVGLYNGGYVMLNRIDYSAEFSEDLFEHSISDIMQDSYGGVWLTTLEDGVFYIPQTEHFSLTKEDQLTSNYILKLDGSDSIVVMIDGLGNITQYSIADQKVVKQFKGYDHASRCEVKYNSFKDEFRVVRHETDVIKGKDIFEISQLSYEEYFISSDSSLVLTSVYANYVLGYLTRNNTNFKPFYVCAIGNHTFRKVFRTKNNRILLTSLLGLYEYKADSLYFLGDANPFLKGRIIDIVDVEGYDFGVATRSRGIVLVKDTNTVVLGMQAGVLSNQISSFGQDPETGLLWIGTSSGISVLSLKNGEVVNLKNNDGLLSEEINDLYIGKKYVFAATKKGVTVVDKSKVQKKMKRVPLYFESYKVNDSIYEMNGQKEINVPYNTSFLEVNCVGLAYGNTNDLEYAYRLNGEFDDWQTSVNENIVFTKLQPGRHELEVETILNNQIVSEQTAKLIINVPFPYWQKTWFILFLIFSFLMFLIGLIRFLVNRIRRIKDAEIKENVLKMNVLNAQMNPHFIFNSLNSVQRFIMMNDKKAANRFLSKFSKLIRRVLKHSENINISLIEELQALELYLQIETERFEHEITYQIDIGSNIDAMSVILPTLLLQPIVENSIWHGIRPKDTAGHIEVKVRRNTNDLIIEIIDNGIGINTAKRLKRKNHESKGRSLVLDRINLFCEAYKVNGTYTTYDLADFDRKKEGTIVKVILPYITKP